MFHLLLFQSWLQMTLDWSCSLELESMFALQVADELSLVRAPQM